MNYVIKKYIALRTRVMQVIMFAFYKYSKPVYGVKKESTNKEKIIVSLTSYPKRFPNLHICIKSILNQTLKPDRIILYLENTIKDEQISDELLELRKYGLEIIKIPEDIKPHKKYYYAIKENSNAVIITTDDDVIYDRKLVESLVESYKKYPDSVSARRVHKILFEENQVAKYTEWEWECREILIPSKQLFATGVGGVLYPPNCMHIDLLDLEKIKKLCLNADDIWLKFMQLKNNTGVVWVKSKYQLPILIKESQEESLNSANVLQDYNDMYIKKLSEFYSINLYEEINK